MRRLVWIASLTSLVLVLTFGVAYAPIRTEAFGDQARYEQLARTLVERGVYARSDGTELAPEPWRALGYPLLLAVVYALTGTLYVPTVILQGIMVAMLPLLAYLIARRLTAERAALAAAFLVALFPSFAFYSIFLLSDLAAVFLVTAGCLATIIATERRDIRAGILAGITFGLAGMVRPVYAPLGMALLIGLVVIDRRTVGRSWRPLAAMALLSLALGAGPQVAYTYTNFGRPGLAAAGTGIQLWLGYWEGVWSGEVTRTIVTQGPPPGLPDRERAQRYHDQYHELYGKIGTLPPPAEVAAWIEADRVALGWARTEISADPAGYVGRALVYRLPVLWAGELPVPDVAQVPRALRVLAWVPQGLLVALAAIGVLVGIRTSVAATIIGGILLYVTVAHLPFYVDPRYSIAAKPAMLVASAVGARAVWGAAHDRLFGRGVSRPS